jgi:hypothetical protein
MNQLIEFKEKIKGMQKMLAESLIKTDDDLEGVSDKVKQVKTLEKIIKEEKEKFVAPAKQIIDEAKTKYDPYIKECQNAEIVLKQRAMLYIEDKEAKQKAQEAKIAADLEKGKINTDKAIEKMEKVKEAPKSTDTGTSKLQMRKVKVVVIQDEALVPDEFWSINEIKVRRVALEREKAGLPQIPGVIIEERSSMASL